jgi:hypothetical protein
MAKFDIRNKQDIQDIFEDEENPLAVGDILVHKPFEIYILEGEMMRFFPNIKLFSATIGTDIYARHGYNTSVVANLT